MAKKKILKQNGQDVFPITNDSCVLDNNGVSLNAKIGNLSDLNTDNKANLVSAINDIVNLNGDIKQQVIEALTDCGIECSINDSWSTIVNKINKGAGGGLDIISATELPATGKENQICAITNKPHTAIYITPDPSCVFNDDSITFLISDDYRTSRGSVCVTNDNMYCFYYFDRAVQNSSGLDVYKCINGAWELFLKKIVTVYDFGKSELGISTGGNQVINTNNNIVQLYITNAYYVSLCFTTLIDFSKYSTCEITFTGGDSSSGRKHNIYIMNSASPTSSIQSALTSFNYAEITSANSISLAGVSEATPLTVTIDISSLKGSGYFGLIDYFNPLTYTTTNISKITIY
jgi:hypothetical protein